MDKDYYTTDFEKRKRGKHLTAEDRGQIQAFKKLGMSNRAIAKEINCSPSTIANELKRGTPPRRFNKGRIPGYSARRGQAVYKQNRKRCHRKYKIYRCGSFAAWVYSQVINHKWSFDECVGYARRKGLFPEEAMVCTKTLYNALRRGQLYLTMFDLPVILKRKTHSRRHAKNKRILGRSIDERPEIPANEYGHWEGDTVIGRKCKGDAAVFTLLEKCSGNYIAIKIPSKDTDAVAYAMACLRREYGDRFPKIFKTITLDNGPEFDEFCSFEEWGTLVYFAHPYSSWERPQNERSNGLLRRFIPKGHSINEYTAEEILQFADEINAKPRRKLKYLAPEELFDAFLDTVYSVR